MNINIFSIFRLIFIFDIVIDIHIKQNSEFELEFQQLLLFIGEGRVRAVTTLIKPRE